MLGANYTVGDFGVGRTTVSLDFNKPYLNQTTCQNALNFSPSIVVIMLGTNDAYLSWQQRSNFTSDYKTLIALFQALPSKPEIFIAVPPPVFNNTMGLNATIVDSVIPLVKQTANDIGLQIIDVHTPLINHPEDFKDGVHPNSQGTKIVATTIFNSITKHFA
jgi:acyl-CoA thioesterase I